MDSDFITYVLGFAYVYVLLTKMEYCSVVRLRNHIRFCRKRD